MVSRCVWEFRVRGWVCIFHLLGGNPHSPKRHSHTGILSQANHLRWHRAQAGLYEPSNNLSQKRVEESHNGTLVPEKVGRLGFRKQHTQTSSTSARQPQAFSLSFRFLFLFLKASSYPLCTMNYKYCVLRLLISKELPTMTSG